MEVSFVASHNQNKNVKTVQLNHVFESIKTGGKVLPQIQKIRELVSAGGNDDLVKAEKGKLPAIMFNGIFNERKNEALISGTGLMILDFDDVKDGFEDELKGNKFVFGYWKSPSGNGFKALLKIPVVKSDADFKSYFYAVQHHFPLVDPSGKDVARLCYFSFDPNIFINEDAVLWEEKISSNVAPSTKNINVHRFDRTNWKLITPAMQMIDNSMVGNRHATMLKVGRLMGGYIAGKEIDESETMTIIQNHIQIHSPDDYKDHIKAFLDGVEHGKREPLTSDEIKTISLEDKLGKIHFGLDDAIDKMDYIYENGDEKGYYLGWADLDELYSLHMGSTTYIYSAPHSGKTQFWMESLVNLSMFYGMRHVIFSPETGDAADNFIELCQIYTRKDFKGAFKMSVVEKEIAYAFVREHFVVIDGDSANKDLNTEDICDYVTLLERKFNKKIHTLTFDPFNELEHDYGHARDLYIEKTLKFVRRNAKNNNRHICIVTHVKDQFPIHVKEKGLTYYPIPTARDIAGGQAWYRKGMMMMAIWRPVMTAAGSNIIEVEIENRMIKSNQTIIQVQKSKPKGRGGVGEVNLYYDWKRHTFTDDFGNIATKKEQRTEPIQDRMLDEIDEPLPF